VFSTTADGSSSPTERMRIDSSGNINVDAGTFYVDAVNNVVGLGSTNPSVYGSNALLVNNNTLTINQDGANEPILQFRSGTATQLGRIQFPPSGLRFVNVSGASEAARIDSSGRLLVGTASNLSASGNRYLQVSNSQPFVILHHNGNNPTAGTTLAGLEYGGQAGGSYVPGAFIRAQTDGDWGSGDAPTRLVFSTTADGAPSPTERMRISNAGQVSVNTTAVSNLAFFDGKLRAENSATVTSFRNTGAAGALVQSIWHEATTGDNQFVSFGTETTRVTRGSITYNRSGGVTAFNTTSDYRAKTILGSLSNPGDTIDSFDVYRGIMNGATIERPMLIAHEAQEVAPYCVTGEKDAVDTEGDPIYQQMDHQVLVPLLIAELQQLRARVAALEAG